MEKNKTIINFSIRNHIVAIIMIALFSISCKTDKKQAVATDLSKNVIEVLEFYGKHRCNSCIDIERNTKATLKKFFKKEIDNKQIVYKLIQWDVPENEAIVNKFEAAGTELYIYRIKDGKEYIDDISDFAFKKSDKDEEFESIFKDKLNKSLALQK